VNGETWAPARGGRIARSHHGSIDFGRIGPWRPISRPRHQVIRNTRQASS